MGSTGKHAEVNQENHRANGIHQTSNGNGHPSSNGNTNGVIANGNGRETKKIQ